MTAFVRPFDLVRSFDFGNYSNVLLPQFSPQFSHSSSTKLISVHYMKVYSGFFTFSSINRKKVFLYIEVCHIKRTCYPGTTKRLPSYYNICDRQITAMSVLAVSYRATHGRLTSMSKILTTST